ncbi:MAG: DUF3618 domain-containing protein [Gemmatimonadota bacterium]
MAREMEQLREEIGHTRDRMSDTLDQLGERLNPKRIKQRVSENIREATIGRVQNMARNAAGRVNDTREGMMHTIRDNPIPAAMVGIGIGWLLLGGRRNQHEIRRRERWPEDLRGYTDSGYVGDLGATTPRLQQDDAAGGIGASVSPEAGGGVRERVSDLADTTRTQAQQLQQRAQRGFEDNPLALGAVALAAGLAAGLAIPETRRESEMMGRTRDRLVERARAAASDVKDRAEEVAERVIDETSRERTGRETGGGTSSVNV